MVVLNAAWTEYVLVPLVCVGGRFYTLFFLFPSCPSTEIQSRRQERKRRTTANPVYSGAVFEPEVGWAHSHMTGYYPNATLPSVRFDAETSRLFWTIMECIISSVYNHSLFSDRVQFQWPARYAKCPLSGNHSSMCDHDCVYFSLLSFLKKTLIFCTFYFKDLSPVCVALKHTKLGALAEKLFF